MLSLENVNNIEETLHFFKNHLGEQVILEMKIDGLSLHLSYKRGKLERAVTRGDGFQGEDVTENARTIRTIPLILPHNSIDVDVRGEVYWRLSSFRRFNEKISHDERFANPRNGASGSMRQKDSKEVSKRKLDFVAYNIPVHTMVDEMETQDEVLSYLESLGFITPTTLPVARDMEGLPCVSITLNKEELTEAIAYMDQYRRALDLDTDGVVIKLQNMAAQFEAGAGTRTPKWAAAYKFPPEIKETCLLGVLIQVGKTGQVTPVAQLEPVDLGGAVVQRASLCNQDELNRLGIDIGDYVKVQRSGEVIPKVVGLARPSPTKSDTQRSYQLPKTCPCCSEQLVRVPGLVNLYCPNEDCKDQVFARLCYAVSKDALDIDGCGENTVRLLMEQKVRSLVDIFRLTNLSFLKPATARKVKEGLLKAKEAPLWRKLSALSIEGIGKVGCQDLAQKYSSLADMVDDPAGVIEVIGRVAAKSLVDYVDTHIDDFGALSGLGFNFQEDRSSAGPLVGKAFCITGKLMSGMRDDVENLIRKHGGAVKGQVTKKVDYLIQGLEGGANKAAGASKWGTRVITEEDLYNMIGIPMPTGGVLPDDVG